MAKIRPYQKKDFRYVQDVCMATSYLADDDTPVNRAMLCAMYCDYYLENQSDFCYVAVNDDDIPVGYLLCTPDNNDYVEKMADLYLPLIKKINSANYFRYSAEIKLEQKYVRNGYTAHFHVDILPDYQRQGIGTQLVNTLETKLTDLFVEGAYLVCSSKNESGRSFYEKMGYEDIDYISGAVVYGKKFFTEDDE